MQEVAEDRLAVGARVAVRLSMVIIFIVFGVQKFTAPEAAAIEPLVSSSPLTSWLMALGVRGMGRVFGTAELTFGLLRATGRRREWGVPALLGAAGSCVTFLTTISFLATAPGVFVPGAAPLLATTGLFLLKDVALLASSFALLAHTVAARRIRGLDWPAPGRARPDASPDRT